MSDEEYESVFFRFETSLHLFFLALKNYIISYKEWSDIEMKVKKRKKCNRIYERTKKT